MLYALLFSILNGISPSQGTLTEVNKDVYLEQYPSEILALKFSCGQNDKGESQPLSLDYDEDGEGIICDCPKSSIQIQRNAKLGELPDLSKFDYNYVLEFFKSQKQEVIGLQVFQKDQEPHFIFVSIDENKTPKYWRYQIK